MKQKSIFLFAFFLLSLLTMAQEAEKPVLPTTFTQQSLVNDVAEGYYVLSGLNENDNECFLQSVQAKNKTKLCAVSLSRTDNKVTISDEKLLWQVIKTSAGKVLLYSPTEKKYLVRKKANSVDVALNAKANDLAEWSYKVTNDGRLSLYEGNRVLVPHKDYNADEDVSYFGNYSSTYSEKDVRGLALYASSNATTSGIITMPTQGQRMCLTSRSTYQTKGGSEMPLNDVLLNNGRIAQTAQMQLLTVELTSATTFCLLTDEGYLSYDMTFSSSPVEWQVQNGCLATVEEFPRFLNYNAGRWYLCSVASLSAPSQWREVVDEPQQSISDKGVCSLKGGWTADALQNLTITDDVKCLDLTVVSLPIKNFEWNALQQKNIPLFVNASDPVPSTWRFVVRCSATENRLLDAALLLTDKVPFYTDRPIRIAKGQVVYKRTSCTDKGWETLSLPFAATISEGAKAYVYDKLENDTLVCKEAVQIDNGYGYLVYREAGQILTLTSLAGEMKSNVEALTSGLLPNMNLMMVSAKTPSIYLLQRSASTFRRAAVGSKLAPFRAYFERNEGRASLKIRIMASPPNPSPVGKGGRG